MRERPISGSGLEEELRRVLQSEGDAVRLTVTASQLREAAGGRGPTGWPWLRAMAGLAAVVIVAAGAVALVH
nr:hypothetical protein [Chloroflexota bacterium]